MSNAESSPSPQDNLWNKQAPIAPKKVMPKKKHKWGLIEVVNSVVILFCLQIALFLGLVVYVTLPYLDQGISGDVAFQNKLITEVQELVLTPPVILLSSLFMYIPWLFMMWYSTRFRGLKSFAKDFWLRFKWPKDLLGGLGIGVLLVAFVQGVSWAASALGFNLAGSDNAAIFKGHGPVWEIVLLIGVVGILGPLMEELFFRGFLMQGFIRHFRRGNVHGPRSSFGVTIQQYSASTFNNYLRFRNWCYKHKYTLSVIITSVIFGFMHFQLQNTFGAWFVVAMTGTLGLVFALITIKTRRLGMNIFAHMSYNTIVAVLSIVLS